MTKNGPLDMRMSRKNPRTAAEIVNTASPAELARIFRDYGEEPRAMHIAARIATSGSIARCAQPLTSRQPLPRWCRERERAIPPPGSFRPSGSPSTTNSAALTRGLEAIGSPVGAWRAFCGHQLPFSGGPDRQDLLPGTQRGMDRPTRMARAASEPCPNLSPPHAASDGRIRRGNRVQPPRAQREAARRRTHLTS